MCVFCCVWALALQVDAVRGGRPISSATSDQNFESLEKYGVDYEEMTAGEHKRTVSMFGKIEPEGREKFLEQLAEIHALFQAHVLRNRPNAKAELIATGEHWAASQAVELGLVDRIATSDDEVMRRVKDREVYEVSYRRPRSWQSRMGRAAAMQLLEGLGLR